MVDITHKQNTLRIATALAILKVGKKETIEAIVNDKVPKGNVFAMSKAAGLLGVKKTPDLLPDCHPLPIEYTGIDFEIKELEIHITMTVKTIYKTGVEVEAMHGASVVALNMYDMLKPIDKQIEIGTIKLLKKTGGKSQYAKSLYKKAEGIKAKVIVCSDTISAGINTDRSGKTAVEKLQNMGITNITLDIIPDNKKAIENAVNNACKTDTRLLLFSGGTGVSPKDLTPQTLLPLFDTELPGISENIRKYGQDRMPFSMLSRGVCGIKNGTLILCVPGSTNGTRDAIDAVCPYIFHLFDVLKGIRHEW